MDRDHRVALPVYRGDGERAEPRPGWRRAHRRQPCVARGAGGRLRLAGYGPERGLPAIGKRGNAQRAQDPLVGMPGQVEQAVDLGHGHGLRPGGHLNDLVPGLYGALVEHPEVEPGPVMGNQQSGHACLVHPDPHPVARHPRLGHLEQRLTDLVAIADAHLVISQAGDREILPELAVAEVVAAQLLLPVPVRLDLVHEHRTVLAAMPGQIALPVTVDIQPPYLTRAVNRLFPDGRADGLPVPRHVLRQPHVDRQQAAGLLGRACAALRHQASNQLVDASRRGPRVPTSGSTAAWSPRGNRGDRRLPRSERRKALNPE